MRDVTIAPVSEGKGRTFRALMLASIDADTLWSGGQANTDVQRPVWAMFAGAETELRPFVANLTSGRKALCSKSEAWRRHKKEDKLEFLKSAGYAATWQREAEGAIVTLYLPDLFALDPGMVEPDGVRFVCVPSKAWVSKQQIATPQYIRHALKVQSDVTDPEVLAAYAPIAFLFAAYLDRRTRCPIVSDGRFVLQLLLACLKHGLASYSNTRSYYGDAPFGEHGLLVEEGTVACGLEKAIAFKASHEAVETLLAEQVTLYVDTTKGK